MKKNIKTAVIYMRSSVKENNPWGIEIQRKRAIDFAVANNLHIINEYIDNGAAGNTFDRPALNQLYKDVESKVIKSDAVLIYDPTILARTSVVYQILLADFKSHKISVLFVTAPTPVTADDILIDRLKMVFTEYRDRLMTKNSNGYQV